MKKPFLPIMILAAVLVLLPASGAKSQETAPGSWTDRLTVSFGGSLLFFLEDNKLEGDASPVIPSLGAALAFHIWGPLFVELTEDLYFTYYGYSSVLDRAVHVDRENRSAFVFGFFTGLELMARFPITEKISIRAYGGPAADLRIVAKADSQHPDDYTMGPETEAVRNYFGSKGRWFYPVVGTGADYAVNDGFLVGLDLRLWFPIYRVWNREKLPAAEGWRIGVGLRFTLR